MELFQNHISSYSKDLHNTIVEIHNKKINEYVDDQINISIIVICKNEERVIERCIQAIMKDKDIKDEIIIIDTGSNDKTIEKILKYRAQVNLFEQEWKENFSEIRNYGISKSIHDWTFFIDADEELVEGSIYSLKKYIWILKEVKLKNVVINPTIINSNGHIVQGVRRIVNKKDNIYYYGLIHEEPRISEDKFGKDIFEISFDNIQLKHDGYEQEILEAKNKIERNISLLRIMIDIEPYYPRWIYFLSRDGKEVLKKEEYEFLLQKTIKLCADNIDYKEYKIRALSDLVAYYIHQGKLKEAEEKLFELKTIAPELSDVFYFQNIIKIINIKSSFFEILNDVVTFKNNKQEIEYGSMHSNLFHMDYLIAELFFEIEEYDKAFNIFNKLEENHFSFNTQKYKNLYNALENSSYKKVINKT